ncbi:hypothetical protein MKX96_12690 [Psychrobacillus sp. FSL W7-1493]|uniref:hypothetical protein n=1 Tax=unclassified Psychrobacillus TaxID=2636677 RepID=UPI002040A580|nr:hypothetical protein [Psychrobacillus sp. MER TA 171]MCM3356812.1 hypothetical protein [Psychrobacillus sp. MER TA 171]
MRKPIIQVIVILLIVVISFGPLLYDFYMKPENSLELYQELRFSEEFTSVHHLLEQGYEKYFSEEAYDVLKSEKGSPSMIRQFTVVQYDDGTESVLIETSPGTNKLTILRAEVLPEVIENYFKELNEE